MSIPKTGRDDSARQKGDEAARQKAQQQAAPSTRRNTTTQAPPSSASSRTGLAGISGHQLQNQLNRQLGSTSLPLNEPTQERLQAQTNSQPSRPLGSDGMQSTFFQRLWNQGPHQSVFSSSEYHPGSPDPRTLQSEPTRDGAPNCVDNTHAILTKNAELAAEASVVFLQDTRNTDGNNTGHLVIERPDGTFIDPNAPQEPVTIDQLQAQGYAPVDAQGRPVDDPAHAYRLPAQDFQRAMNLPPDQREAALDAAGVPEPIQGFRLADGPLGWVEDNIIKPTGNVPNDHILPPWD